MASTDDIALVRLWCADVATAEADQLITDAQYDRLITANAGNLRLAAADALEAVAASEVLVGKKIRTQDLATDGVAVSAELRALADRHRQLAQVPADDFFEIVETVPDDGCAPERSDRWTTWW